MKAALGSLLSLLMACQPTSGVDKAAESSKAKNVTPMGRDLERVCNQEEASGALELPPGDRAMHTAIWLANALETQPARELMAELTQLPPAPRIARLRKALVAEGMAEDCQVLHAW